MIFVIVEYQPKQIMLGVVAVPNMLPGSLYSVFGLPSEVPVDPYGIDQFLNWSTQLPA
jgi:phosphoribosylcarboxyaminoimidazole (NCAIR) mutase